MPTLKFELRTIKTVVKVGNLDADVKVTNLKEKLATWGNRACAKILLIVFLSDNGGPVDVNASVNAPYRGQKGILLEGGIHVPFVMNWSGTISAGTVFHDPVSSLDIAPTFLANAGGLTDKLEGVNLVSNSKQTKSDLAERQLKWRFTISAAIREGKWKLVRLPDRLPMLYNLEKDSSELHDVSLTNLDKTKTLLKKLGDWDVSLPHPVFLEGAVWKKRQLHLYDVPYPLVQPR